jgi:lipoprotein signal peptidase
MLVAMRSRRSLLVSVALAFAMIDLVHKTFTTTDFHHARSAFVAILIGGVVAALVVLVPRVPSTAAALGAGIASGGAIGNLVSLFAWPQGVPDPLVVAGASRGVAFNLADLFAVFGDALLLSGVFLYGLRERDRLRERI